MMAWGALIVAGIFEMLGVFSIHRVLSKPSWRTFSLFLVTFSLSFVLLWWAMLEIPMSTAYAVWTGIGATGGALLGMIFFGESTDWKRLLCIGCILAAAVGLKIIA